MSTSTSRANEIAERLIANAGALVHTIDTMRIGAVLTLTDGAGIAHPDHERWIVTSARYPGGIERRTAGITMMQIYTEIAGARFDTTEEAAGAMPHPAAARRLALDVAERTGATLDLDAWIWDRDWRTGPNDLETVAAEYGDFLADNAEIYTA